MTLFLIEPHEKYKDLDVRYFRFEAAQLQPIKFPALRVRKTPKLTGLARTKGARYAITGSGPPRGVGD